MYKRFIKRILDFFITLLLLPFVLILIVIMAPIIYFDDKGPIFYTAVRHGMNGKPFKMLKFRSMYVNSPDIKNPDGSTFNSANDFRVTKIGKIMRKTSLDEIPQILNVLKGDMSIIGPRPTIAATSYEELSPIRKKSLSVRPGITGYSQAFYRNSINQDQKFLNDCKYVDNIS
ncbi:MAG: sugar transferase, partial [Erysipelotrichaceae bacterium]|nr:sugar transferase [Erysipelotrichaceae bacterium]